MVKLHAFTVTNLIFFSEYIFKLPYLFCSKHTYSSIHKSNSYCKKEDQKISRYPHLVYLWLVFSSWTPFPNYAFSWKLNNLQPQDHIHIWVSQIPGYNQIASKLHFLNVTEGEIMKYVYVVIWTELNETWIIFKYA